MLQEYKCPCCGGAINFDSNLQKMKCPFCDTEFDMDTLKSYDNILKNDHDDDMKWSRQSNNEWNNDELDKMYSYVCKSCGGEIMADANTAATKCPYCDNPIVMMEQFAGFLKPDYVIPFKLDKEAAKSALSNHLNGKRLLPKVFKEQNHIDEIIGMYVPYWLFDSDVAADIRYRATRVHIHRSGSYEITETSHFAVVRDGTIGFDNVPVDGSVKMDDTLMESLEPYNFAEAVDFQTAYLAGYLADKYDVSAEDGSTRVNSRIKRSTEEEFLKTVTGYATVRTENSNLKLSNAKAKYALYPVWILNTTWKGNHYTFAMNGQTGKFAGDLPMDKSIRRKWRFGLTMGIGAALCLISFIICKFMGV